eukprot:3454289-Prymnesium_polylepis.1
MLLGLLAAVMADMAAVFEDVRFVRFLSLARRQAESNSLLRHSRHAEVLELVRGEMLCLEL